MRDWIFLQEFSGPSYALPNSLPAASHFPLRLLCIEAEAGVIECVSTLMAHETNGRHSHHSQIRP